MSGSDVGGKIITMVSRYAQVKSVISSPSWVLLDIARIHVRGGRGEIRDEDMAFLTMLGASWRCGLLLHHVVKRYMWGGRRLAKPWDTLWFSLESHKSHTTIANYDKEEHRIFVCVACRYHRSVHPSSTSNQLIHSYIHPITTKSQVPWKLSPSSVPPKYGDEIVFDFGDIEIWCRSWEGVEYFVWEKECCVSCMLKEIHARENALSRPNSEICMMLREKDDPMKMTNGPSHPVAFQDTLCINLNVSTLSLTHHIWFPNLALNNPAAREEAEGDLWLGTHIIVLDSSI